MTTDLVPTYAVILVCVGYGLAVWLVQMYRAAPPRDWLLERIRWLHTEIEARDWRVGQAGKDDLEAIANGLHKPWLFLPVSRVQAGWRNIHGLEDDHAPELNSPEVDEQLRTARAKLKVIPGDEVADIVKRIDASLKDAGAANARAALLREAEVFRHNISDSNYENLANLLSKAVWLTWAALALVVALAAMFDRESFFLLGAAGALISRLTRVLRRRPSASDYGAEWSTLVLAPAAGAVAGWVGVALVAALSGDPFNVMTSSFAKPWDDPTLPLGLALAFVFGFSERSFNKLLGVAESQVAGKFPKDETKSGGEA